MAAETDEFQSKRLEMVETQIIERGISCEATIEAMSEVPRHRFVSGRQVRAAYQDRPLPIGHGQTISQPYIVALMTELIRPSSDDTVLEIGTGSGYQAAVLSPITREVYTVEIIDELARTASGVLEEVGYDNVKVKSGDGYYGWEEHAPFDAIVVTAAAPYIPPPLLEQLKPGGRMVIPVGGVFQTQRLMLVTRDEEGEVQSRNILPVRFVPFTRKE